MIEELLLKAYIRSVGAYVPPKKISNDELAKTVDTSDEWIYSHTGIQNRHIAADEMAASDLAVKAAASALEKSDIKAKDIDLILVATATPDFLGFPSTAAIVQDKIGASHAAAMDITAACTGFIYAIETAKAFIESGSAQNALVIGSEVLSRILDWTDRDTCVLFGDGAGAAIITGNEESLESNIRHSILRSDGSGAEYLLVRGCGSQRPENNEKVNHPYIHMNGRKVYMFAVKALCETIKRLLQDNDENIDDITYIVPHQANIRIIEAAAKRMKIPKEKFYTNIAEFANTSAASIPLALNEMDEKNLLKRGNMILTIGFGGGLTYGGNLIHW
ncbi:MAG: ketoacyl-ACP synthase III [Spirochaetales bacterium]|jgi:3-oxoacyl-[acyl-carrier-protein] synthase III|nr:ketoacyl-ACP synthase III [Spirochaetales bacterium]